MVVRSGYLKGITTVTVGDSLLRNFYGELSLSVS